MGPKRTRSSDAEDSQNWSEEQQCKKPISKRDSEASQFRGVTHHCRTQRFEVRFSLTASQHIRVQRGPLSNSLRLNIVLLPGIQAHIWEGKKQLYLGGYSSAPVAALAFDIASIRFRGAAANTNYHMSHYAPFIPELLQVFRVIPASIPILLSFFQGGLQESFAVMHSPPTLHPFLNAVPP